MASEVIAPQRGEVGDRVEGKVKWFDAVRGWGFIQPKDGSEDVFVHQQCISMQGFRSLDDDEEVEYEVKVDHNQRKRAVKVTGPNGAQLKGSSRPMSYRGGRGGPFQQSNSRQNYSNGQGSDRSYNGERGGYERHRSGPERNYNGGERQYGSSTRGESGSGYRRDHHSRTPAYSNSSTRYDEGTREYEEPINASSQRGGYQYGNGDRGNNVPSSHRSYNSTESFQRGPA